MDRFGSVMVFKDKNREIVQEVYLGHMCTREYDRYSRDGAKLTIDIGEEIDV